MKLNQLLLVLQQQTGSDKEENKTNRYAKSQILHMKNISDSHLRVFISIWRCEAWLFIKTLTP
jgi:hypothetical protein